MLSITRPFKALPVVQGGWYLAQTPKSRTPTPTNFFCTLWFLMTFCACKNAFLTCIFCRIWPNYRQFTALPVVPGGSNLAVTSTGVVRPGTNSNRNVMTYSFPTHTGTICKNRVITLFSCIFCIIRPYNRHFKALPVVPGGSNFAVTLTGVVRPGTNFNRNVMTYSFPTHTGTIFL